MNAGDGRRAGAPSSQHCVEQDAEVSGERGVAHVVRVKPVFGGQDRVAIEADERVLWNLCKEPVFTGKGKRGRAGDTGAAGQEFQLLLGDFGARANEAHVAEEHVDELRKLVQLEAAQNAANRSNFLGGEGRDGASAFVRSMAHGAKFVDCEGPVKAAGACLLEDDWTARGKAHCNGDDQQRRNPERRTSENRGDVKDTLGGRCGPDAQRLHAEHLPPDLDEGVRCQSRGDGVFLSRHALPRVCLGTHYGFMNLRSAFSSSALRFARTRMWRMTAKETRGEKLCGAV